MDYVASLGEGGRNITPDARLLENGLLDSINLVQLIQFLEERFGVAIPDADLVPETFESVAKIAAYVAERTA